MTENRLSELHDWQLQHEDQDVCGKPLLDASGKRLGLISDMIVDTDAERVSAVVLEDGQRVPVEELELKQDFVVTHGRPRSSAQFVHVRLVRITSSQTS